MQTRTPVIVLSTVAAGATAFRRTLSFMAELALAGTLMLGGCGPAMTRPQVSEQDLLKLRTKGDEQAVAEGRRVLGGSLERAKAEYDRSVAEGRKERPVVDILIISGGGDWGAFGAGFLKGWQKVPAQHPLAKPEFDAVTGVSTGTLIAPFAFLGDQQSIDQIVYRYRTPQEDWVKQRGFLYFLPDNINQFRPVPVVTAPNWVAVISRSLETSSRAATATAVRHLFAMAEISRLQRNAHVEVRVVSIPGDWVPPVPGVFKKETMNNLADLGEKMGTDPASWSSEPSAFSASLASSLRSRNPLGFRLRESPSRP